MGKAQLRIFSFAMALGIGLTTFLNPLTVLADSQGIRVIVDAQDRVTTHTVTFNSNGGSSVSAQTVNNGVTASRPSNPVRNGYVFLDWYSDSNLSARYDFSTPVTDNITLYAAWQKETVPNEPEKKMEYLIRFDSKDGSAVSSQTIESGKTVVKPSDPSRMGYVFDGWYTDENYSYAYSFSSPVNSNMVLYAKWKKEIAKTYTVVFETNGGTSIGNKTIIAGDILSKPDTPKKSGYIFDAWYTDIKCTSRYDFSKPVNSNFTLYANWDAIKQFTVKFNSNGGSSVGKQTVEKNAKLTKPKTPIRKGYVFRGWYTTNSLSTKYNFNNKVTKNMTLYAKWKKVEISILPTNTSVVNPSAPVNESKQETKPVSINIPKTNTNKDNKETYEESKVSPSESEIVIEEIKEEEEDEEEKTEEETEEVIPSTHAVSITENEAEEEESKLPIIPIIIACVFGSALLYAGISIGKEK